METFGWNIKGAINDMRCPKCYSEMMSRVYGVKEYGDAVRRNRECTVCKHRYVTLEKVIGVPRKLNKTDRSETIGNL